MGPEKIGHRWILILLLCLIMAGCSTLDRFLDTGKFCVVPQEDIPKSSGKRIPTAADYSGPGIGQTSSVRAANFRVNESICRRQAGGSSY